MGSIILDAILYGIAVLFYYVEVAMAKILDMLYDMFYVFVGIEPVKYNGVSTDILDVFFKDELITGIYWGMVCISLCLLFAFAIITVVRKAFDSSGEKVKQSYTDILVTIFKSALIMFLMTALMQVATSSCSVILTAVDDLFNNVSSYTNPSTIYFDETDFANMFRVVDTIANYGMNSSSNNRFNVNICFNEVASDMQTLESTGMFRYTYEGAENSWQYYLKQLYVAADIHEGVPIDEYNDAVSDAITAIMYQTRYNSSFKPVKTYSRTTASSDSDISLGTVLMLSSSFNAANNDNYNGNSASLTDNVRAPYYNGSKSLYSRDVMEDSFNIRFGCWDHIACLVSLYIAIGAFLKIVFNCTARIFNMVYLYIIAPPFIAAMPLDGGGKLKQWLTAFIIQSTSIIGIYISVRLMLMFIPMITNSSFVLFQSSTLNILAKVILLVGIMETAEKSSSMLTGILADNAGMQAIASGDVGGVLTDSLTKKAGGMLNGMSDMVNDVTGLSTLGKDLSDYRESMRKHGGLLGIGRDKKDEKAKANADKMKEMRMNDFMDRSLAALEGMNSPQRTGSAESNEKASGGNASAEAPVNGSGISAAAAEGGAAAGGGGGTGGGAAAGGGSGSIADQTRHSDIANINGPSFNNGNNGGNGIINPGIDSAELGSAAAGGAAGGDPQQGAVAMPIPE